MRKPISSIILLLVFLYFQFGNMMNYWYCSWQAAKVNPALDCNCEIHLTPTTWSLETGQPSQHALPIYTADIFHAHQPAILPAPGESKAFTWPAVKPNHYGLNRQAPDPRPPAIA